jgi:two-component system cell cycle response regulator DivK
MATILIVEDNAANMKLVVFALQHAGYIMISAADAEAGLTSARQELPDLSLTDVQLFPA